MHRSQTIRHNQQYRYRKWFLKENNRSNYINENSYAPWVLSVKVSIVVFKHRISFNRENISIIRNTYIYVNAQI